MIYDCTVKGCGAQLAAARPVKLWHRLDGSHSVQCLDEAQPDPPLVRTHKPSEP